MPSLAGKHAAHLMVAALGEGERRTARAGDLQAGGQAGLGLVAQDEVATREDFDQFGVQVFVHGDFVDLERVGLGGGVAVDEVALVGDENQAAGFLVQPSHAGDDGVAVQPGFREQFVDVRALGLAVGATVADGFVEHGEDAVGRLKRFAIDGDKGGVGFLVGAGGGHASDGDATFTDPGGGFATGAITEGGEDLIETAHGKKEKELEIEFSGVL